jgi:hypothetical protein
LNATAPRSNIAMTKLEFGLDFLLYSLGLRVMLSSLQLLLFDCTPLQLSTGGPEYAHTISVGVDDTN